MKRFSLLFTFLVATALAAVAQVSIPWTDVEDTPTTLAGYGITDALTEAALDAELASRQVSASGLVVNVPAFRTGPFSFAGGSLSVVPSGTWFVGVDLYRNTLIALPRLGHRGWVPVAKVVAGASAVTGIEQIRPELPATRIPRTLQKMRKGQSVNALVLGSSLAEGSGTDRWSGMLFGASASITDYKLPSILGFSNFALGGTPNQYIFAQLGLGSRHSSTNIGESGIPQTVVDKSPPNGRGSILAGIDLVVLTVLANGGDYRLEVIDPIVRRLRQQGVEVVLTSDNPQGPTNSYATMAANAGLFPDGPEVLRIADLYGVEFADTAAYVFEQHLRYGSGIYSDTIHMTAAAPAGPAVAQPSSGHEVYARAIRSLFTVTSNAVGVSETTYNFSDGTQGFVAFSMASIAWVAGELHTTKTTGASNQWGSQIAIPPIKNGDTVRVQGTYAWLNGYTGNNLGFGLQGGGSGWGSTTTQSAPGSFDVTVTATRDILSGGRILFFGNNDAAPLDAGFSLDNVVVTVNSTHVILGTDTIVGRPQESRSLPPSRVVSDLKTPGDAFVILPKDEQYWVSNNGARGTLGAHPAGAGSFARRFSSAVGAGEDLLTLTVGQKAVVNGIGVVGLSLIRYASTADPAVEIEVRANNVLLKTMTIGVAASTRESYHPIFTPTEYNNAAVLNNVGVEITVTSGTLKIAALVALTADVEFVSARDIVRVGTWAEETTFMPGFYTDTPGSYAYVHSRNGRQVWWLLANRSNSQPVDFYTSGAQLLNQAMVGVNHMRVRGGVVGTDTRHSIKLVSAAASPVAGNRSLHIGGAIIVNDR